MIYTNEQIKALADQFTCHPVSRSISDIEMAGDMLAELIEHHLKLQKMEAALLWTLYHHQGGSSHIGQPIRKLLDIGQYDHLTAEQIADAKAFAADHSEHHLNMVNETSVPAIVFYPAGSLGEAVGSEGGEA